MCQKNPTYMMSEYNDKRFHKYFPYCVALPV